MTLDNNTIVQLIKDSSGNFVFFDTSGSLKIYYKEAKNIRTIEEGDYTEGCSMIKINHLKDRILFRKNNVTLQEYELSAHSVRLVREITDEKWIIDDFTYFRNKEKKNDDTSQIVIISNDGRLKRINPATKVTKKYEIDPDGKNFKIAFNNFLGYGLIAFNRISDEGSEQIAYVVELTENEVKFVNKVTFDTGIGNLEFIRF